MTKKRFTLKGLIEGVPNICDNDEIIEQEEAVMLLNELHEENQLLKERRHEDINELSVIAMRFKALEKENEQLKKDRDELFVRERDTKNDWRELKQENEQLRHQIETYKSGNALLKKTLDKEWK